MTISLHSCSKQLNIIPYNFSLERLNGHPKTIQYSYYDLNKNDKLVKDSGTLTYYFSRNKKPVKIIHEKFFDFLLESHISYNDKQRVIIEKTFKDGIEIDGNISHYYNKNGKITNAVSVFENDTIVNIRYVHHSKRNKETIQIIENDSIRSYKVKKYFKQGKTTEELIYEMEDGILRLTESNYFVQKNQKTKSIGYSKFDLNHFSNINYFYNEQKDLIRTERFVIHKNDTLSVEVDEKKYVYDEYNNRIREEHFNKEGTYHIVEYKIEYY